MLKRADAVVNTRGWVDGAYRTAVLVSGGTRVRWPACRAAVPHGRERKPRASRRRPAWCGSYPCIPGGPLVSVRDRFWSVPSPDTGPWRTRRPARAVLGISCARRLLSLIKLYAP